MNALLLSVLLGAAAATGKPVAYNRIAPGDYASFVGNWDDKKFPVLCALIRTTAEWDAVLHPAPVMRQRKPFSPDASIYEKQQIIIISRVTDAPGDKNQPEPLQIKEVTEADGTLTVRYQFTEPAKKASYQIKAHVGLLIPKQTYKQVIFIENDKLTTTLKIAEGQSRIPQ